METNIEKLHQKKQRLFNQLEKVIKEIAIQEDIQLQSAGGRTGKQKTPSDFEREVRAKFRITNKK